MKNYLLLAILLLTATDCYAQIINPTQSFSAPVNIGTPSITDTGVALQATGSQTGYYQIILQNTNAGTGASADYIVNNNLGTASTYYGDFGMNSSTFTGTGNFSLANAVYLYSYSGDLSLGTWTSNAIHFITANTATDAMTISSGGNTSLTGTLTVTNTANVASILSSSNTTGTSFELANTSSGGHLYYLGSGGSAGATGDFTIYDGTGGWNALVIDGSGNPYFPKISSSATTSALCVNTGNGEVTYNATVGTCTVSDGRLKNIDSQLSNVHDKLMAIHGYYFHFKDEKQYGKGQQLGVIAQEVQKQFPELVSEDSTGKLSADYQKLVVPLIVGYQEQQKELDELKRSQNGHACFFGLLICAK